MVSCVIRIILRSVYFCFPRWERLFAKNTVCVLFIFFSLEAIVGLKCISGKSTIEQLFLYSY